MNITLKTLFAVAALGAATYASAISIPANGQVLLEDTPYDGGYTGGEFEGTVAGFNTFYTFCLEKNQNIVLPDTYNYALSNAVDSNGDVLSAGAAYLYEKFINGALYSRDLDAQHDTNAGVLQVAIWYLEGEVNQWFSGVAGNVYLADAYLQFGSEANAKADDVKGVVKVMNITKNGQQFQDVLVYVPDSGTTLALLGLGLAAMAIGRRRRSA